MDQNPLVSVVIPARDAERFLPAALDSVVSQDYAPLEVVVVDDGSQDGTAAIVERYGASHPVRLVRLPASGGAAHARNVGIEAARGEIIAFQDADDEWLPGKLRKQVAMLTADERLVFVACGCRLISPAGDDIGPCYEGQIPQAGGRAWPALLARNTMGTPCIVAWRRILLAEGGFDTSLRVAEDQDLWIRLAMRGHLGYLDEHLVRVNIRPDSLSSRGHLDQIDVALPMIERHLAARRGDLSAAERRWIIGERHGRIGREAYRRGAYRTGLGLIASAITHGDRPLGNLIYVATTMPPVMWLRQRLASARS
jgi:glycosyltransferase involved in cell wall biosynthesis